MSTRTLRACAWCGPVFVVVFFAGAIIAGIIPPPSPSNSTAKVVDFYGDHPDLTRLGLFLMMIAAGFTAPFVVAISIVLKRIEGSESPMAWLQLIGGTLGVIAILVPVMLFVAAAFRPDRSPELIRAINDMAWLPFIINFPPAFVQACAVGVAVIGDRRAEPLVPRWVGYYNFWTAFLFIPGGLAMFFKHGAFAWNGLLAFWLAATVFGSWFLVMSVVTRRALARPLT